MEWIWALLAKGLGALAALIGKSAFAVIFPALLWCHVGGPCDPHYEHACDGAIGQPLTPDVADMLSGMVLGPSDAERTWLDCIAARRADCGVRRLSIHSIFSDLPRRWDLDVRVVHGRVRRCEIHETAGW